MIGLAPVLGSSASAVDGMLMLILMAAAFILADEMLAQCHYWFCCIPYLLFRKDSIFSGGALQLKCSASDLLINGG